MTEPKRSAAYFAGLWSMRLLIWLGEGLVVGGGIVLTLYALRGCWHG